MQTKKREDGEFGAFVDHCLRLIWIWEDVVCVGTQFIIIQQLIKIGILNKQQ